MRFLVAVMLVCIAINSYAVEYENVVIEKIEHPYLEAKVEYPYFVGHNELNMLIASIVYQGWPTNHEQVASEKRKVPWEQTEADYCDIKLASQLSDEEYCEKYSMRYAIQYIDERYVNLLFSKAWYYANNPGGIQIWHKVDYDFSKDKELRLDDFFDPSTYYYYELAKIVTARLPANKCARGVEKWTGEIANWHLNDEGFVFTFDLNKICKYASGAETITIPFSELKDILADPNLSAAR